MNIPSDLYRRKKEVELYTRLYSWFFSFLFLHAPHHYQLDSDFITVNKEYIQKVNASESAGFNAAFYSTVFTYLYQCSHSSINKVIDLPDDGNNLRPVYFVKNDLINLFDWKRFYQFIGKTFAEKRDREYLLNLDHLVKLYMTTGHLDQMDRLSTFCRSFLSNEFDLSIDRQGYIIFPYNGAHSYFFYTKQLLQNSGSAKTLDEIIDELRKSVPHLSIKKTSLQTVVSSNTDTFISFGKSGRYGLKIWEATHDYINGGSLTTAAKKCLENSSEPLHKDKLFQKVKKYRKISCSIMIQRLKYPRDKSVFLFFEGDFIGLKTKRYDPKFIIAE